MHRVHSSDLFAAPYLCIPHPLTLSPSTCLTFQPAGLALAPPTASSFPIHIAHIGVDILTLGSAKSGAALYTNQSASRFF